MFETLRNRFALPQRWQSKQFFKPKVILSFAGLILAAVHSFGSSTRFSSTSTPDRMLKDCRYSRS